MFADTTEDGVTTTKAEHEAAYQADLDAKAAESVRTQRDAKLAESDWMVIKSAETGVALATEWATYRQALRDITEQAGFPNTVEWPEV
jgi:peptide subunit release factor RF-3